MTKIEWDQKYSLGIKEIDSQHQHLFSLINKLIANNQKNFDPKLVDSILEKMIYYARYHFKTEEEYMRSINYKHLDTHRKEHLSFIKKTADLSLNSMRHNEQLHDELLSFLTKWWTEHILVSDLKIIEPEQ